MIQVCNDQLNFQNKYDPALNENEMYFFLKKASIMYKCEIPVIFIIYIVVTLKTHFEVIDLMNFRFIIMMNLISCKNIVNNDSKNCIVNHID